MKCEFCRFGPQPDSEGYVDGCPNFDTHGTTWKDGRDGCTLTYSHLKRLDNEYAEYLGNMGTDMGFDMTLEQEGIAEDAVIKVMKHMIGMYPEGRRKIYHRHGKAFYRPYRNGYGGQTRILDVLEHCEFAYSRESDPGMKPQMKIYHLTRHGLDWLGRRIKVTIHDEED